MCSFEGEVFKFQYAVQCTVLSVKFFSFQYAVQCVVLNVKFLVFSMQFSLQCLV